MANDATGRQPSFQLAGGEAFEVLFTRSPLAMLLTAGNATIRAANGAACRLLGRDEPELLRTPASDLVHPDDRGVMVANAARVIAEGRSEVRSERRFVRPDGTAFWTLTVAQPVRTDDDAVAYWHSVIVDISAQRDQLDQLQRQRDEILRLSTPLIEIADGTLVLPIIGSLDAERTSQLTTTLLDRIARGQARVVILDISGVESIDATIAQHLLTTAETIRLMGSVSILSGIRPELARTFVHLGIDLGPLRCHATLKDALRVAALLPQEGRDRVRTPLEAAPSLSS